MLTIATIRETNSYGNLLTRTLYAVGTRHYVISAEDGGEVAAWFAGTASEPRDWDRCMRLGPFVATIAEAQAQIREDVAWWS